MTEPGVGANRYAYAFNDPVNLRDPGGNDIDEDEWERSTDSDVWETGIGQKGQDVSEARERARLDSLIDSALQDVFGTSRGGATRFQEFAAGALVAAREGFLGPTAHMATTSTGISGGPVPHRLGGLVIPGPRRGQLPIAPGRVQSRINLERGGWQHVLDQHFNPGKNKSQFTVSPSELRQILQSKEVVGAPVSRVLESSGGARYVRDVRFGSPIGTDKFDNFRPTSTMSIVTDRYGNLVTASPGVIR